ncbi:MAG: glycosyltransferase [Myxococcota bacterium]
MRVYHLIKGLGRGGAEMLLPEGLRESDRERFQYRVGYFLPHKNALVPNLEAINVPVDCFDATANTRILSRIPRLAGVLKAWNADVLHCHLPIAGVAGRLAGRVAGVPVVYTEHNIQERYHPLTGAVNRRTWRLQSRVVACSEEVAASIERNLGTSVPVTVVQNGVSLNAFRRDPSGREEVRRRLGVPEDGLLVGTVAVFREQKRLPEWLRVAKAVLASVPRAHFVIVGDGPLRTVIEEEVRQLGLEGRVSLPGLQSDVSRWLSAMDLYLMTSAYEGLPVALLEAMACELPAFCTRVGGIGEAVRDGREGYLVAAEEPMALVEPLVALSQDDERRIEMGRAARARVEAAFGMERMMDQLQQVYEEVLSG